MGWTASQQNAIDARERNILVSAAAGSGKTAVLVARVIKLITDKQNPVDIDKFLIVTFTNAAAAEMKSRISAALEEKLHDSPRDPLIMRQLSLLPGAQICTIDSFCLDLVRENFFNIGVSRDFTIMQNSEEHILSETALNSVLDEFFDEGYPDFISLVEMLSPPKNDKALISAVKSLYTYINAQAYPIEWLRKAVECYNPDIPFENTEWNDMIFCYAKEALQSAEKILEECFDFVDPNDEVADKYLKCLNDDKRILSEIIKAVNSGIDDAYNYLSEKISFLAFRVDRTGKNKYSAPFKEEVASRRNLFKELIGSVKDLFVSDSSEYKQDCLKLYPSFCALLKVVERFDQEFRKLKDERNAYTFADGEHFALQLLMDYDENGNIVRSELANQLKDKYYEILVDEYQDTNDVQDTLFRLLSNGSNRFMVGDVKQSIYRFRLAMPFIFTQKKERYKNYTDSNKGESAKIILDKNFRSRKEICGFTNFLFSKFMSSQTGELDYNEAEFLNSGADYPERDLPCVSLKVIDGISKSKISETEAPLIAKLIIDKINSKEQVYDSKKKQLRDIRYGDIAVLMRRGKGSIPEFAKVFAQYGIPCISENSGDLFECSEVKLIISLLRVIDNPMQDIPLLSIMMSPLYGFTADELTDIKLESDFSKCSLYTAVVNSDSEKVKSFLGEIFNFSQTAVTMPVAEFIRYLCEYKSIFAFAGALGNSQQRIANINAFIDFAEQFDSSKSVGLTSFVRLVDKIEESDDVIDAKPVGSSTENAVTFMTVHHSKGLEFPIVILAECGRDYVFRETDGLIFNAKKGIAAKVHDDKLMCNQPDIPFTVIKKTNRVSALSECLRVLYVAVTRAKEQFIAFVSVENLEGKIAKFAPGIASGFVDPVLCRRYLSDGDFLISAAMMHKNGDKLRSMSPVFIKTCHSDFELDVELLEPSETDEELQTEEKSKANMNIVEQIEKSVGFTYKGLECCNEPAKRNASELDEAENSAEEPIFLMKPAFLNNTGLDAAQRGTAMHAFMQFCDFSAAAADLNKEIERLFKKGYLTDEQAQALDRKALCKLFASELGARMLKSDKIYRELNLSSFLTLADLHKFDSDEKVLVRGIADCIFEENGELVLIDYKTDKVKNEDELLGRYKNQIRFYRNIAAKSLQKNVKEAGLYSFYLGKVCKY